MSSSSRAIQYFLPIDIGRLGKFYHVQATLFNIAQHRARGILVIVFVSVVSCHSEDYNKATKPVFIIILEHTLQHFLLIFILFSKFYQAFNGVFLWKQLTAREDQLCYCCFFFQIKFGEFDQC